MLDTEAHVLACYRHIELNPVRAGMVDVPELYRWCSHAANAHQRTDGIVTPHASYEALGGAAAYRQLCRDAPPQNLVDEIRRATRAGCVAGQVRRRGGRPTARK
jgi:putative transposase